jgi:hypothetical protein
MPPPLHWRKIARSTNQPLPRIRSRRPTRLDVVLGDTWGREGNGAITSLLSRSDVETRRQELEDEKEGEKHKSKKQVVNTNAQIFGQRHGQAVEDKKKQVYKHFLHYAKMTTPLPDINGEKPIIGGRSYLFSF